MICILSVASENTFIRYQSITTLHSIYFLFNSSKESVYAFFLIHMGQKGQFVFELEFF